MVKRPAIFIALTCLLPLSAMAEYRVYQYSVKSRLKMPRDQKAYIVTSTLDPTSYLSYNGGHEALKIDLMRTWTCKGYTGNGKELCAPPEEVLRNEDQ
jgi:hypothetical protein